MGAQGINVGHRIRFCCRSAGTKVYVYGVNNLIIVNGKPFRSIKMAAGDITLVKIHSYKLIKFQNIKFYINFLIFNVSPP
jgi:hypothetical protein